MKKEYVGKEDGRGSRDTIEKELINSREQGNTKKVGTPFPFCDSVSHSIGQV